MPTFQAQGFGVLTSYAVPCVPQFRIQILGHVVFATPVEGAFVMSCQ